MFHGITDFSCASVEGKLEVLEKKKDVTAEEIVKLQTEISNIPPKLQAHRS